MIIYDIEKKQLVIPTGLGNLNGISYQYIETLRKEGYDEGYVIGFEEGEDEGYAEGKEEGIAQGRTEGYNEGYQTGNAEGYNAGFTTGKTEGIEEGFEDGYATGKVDGVDEYVEGLPTLNIVDNGTYDEVNKGVTVAIPLEKNVTKTYTDVGEYQLLPSEGYKGIENATIYFEYTPSTNKLPDGITLNGSTFTELDMGDWDWSDVHSWDNMFYNCGNLQTITNFPSYSKPYGSLGQMFILDTQLKSIDGIENWDISNVTNMNSCFSSCRNLTSLDLSNWDTSNVNRMDGMFKNCSNLTSIDLSNWDTSNVNRMDSMFNGCSSLTSIDLSNWDTSNVNRMDNMFSQCSNLTSLDLSNWDTSNVNTMVGMFDGCSSLTSIDLSNWDTSKVISMEYMFSQCSNLASIDLSGWIKVHGNLRYMFSGCGNLTEVKMGADVSNLNSNLVYGMFGGINTTGTFYYNPQYDYSKIIAVLPSTWTAVPME